MSPTIAIVGTSTGIGLNLVRHFLQAGYRVVALSRQPEVIWRKVSADPKIMAAISGSLEEHLRLMTYDEFGPESALGDFTIDHFINVSGRGGINLNRGSILSGSKSTFKPGPSAERSPTSGSSPTDRLKEMLEVNTLFVLEMVDRQWSYFKNRRSHSSDSTGNAPSIPNRSITMVSSLSVNRRGPTQFEYSVSKLAINKLLLDYAPILIKEQIRLNEIRLGYVEDTEITRACGDYNQKIQDRLPTQKKTIHHHEIFQLMQTVINTQSIVGSSLEMNNASL